MGQSVLITGGVRSGKTSYAQRRAEEITVVRGQPALYLAPLEGPDTELKERMERHHKEHGVGWVTIEAPLDAADRLAAMTNYYDVVVLDGVTFLVANLIFSMKGQPDDKIRDRVERVARRLGQAAACGTASSFIVSNEIGMGLAPQCQAELLFQDLAGRANRIIAHEVEDVVLMVSGYPIRVKGRGPI